MALVEVGNSYLPIIFYICIMDIKIKDSIHILHQGQEYIVRPGTIGVEKNRVVFFHDVTRTAAVGYSREHCLENPQVFAVSRTLSDKEVSMSDVLKVIRELPLNPQIMGEVELKLKSL